MTKKEAFHKLYFRGEVFRPQNTTSTVKHGDGSIMLMACLDAGALRKVSRVETETKSGGIYSVVTRKMNKTCLRRFQSCTIKQKHLLKSELIDLILLNSSQ